MKHTYIVLVIHNFRTDIEASNISRACKLTLDKYKKKDGKFPKPYAYQGIRIN